MEELKDYIDTPRNPQNRIIAQKSIFVRPPRGFVERQQFTVINIPEFIKVPMLDHLQKQHGISTQTVCNDLHGFIRNQSSHQNTYIESYRIGTQQREDFLQQDRS